MKHVSGERIPGRNRWTKLASPKRPKTNTILLFASFPSPFSLSLIVPIFISFPCDLRPLLQQCSLQVMSSPRSGRQTPSAPSALVNTGTVSFGLGCRSRKNPASFLSLCVIPVKRRLVPFYSLSWRLISCGLVMGLIFLYSYLFFTFFYSPTTCSTPIFFLLTFPLFLLFLLASQLIVFAVIPLCPFRLVRGGGDA